jgi:sodium-dependent dicarboxylate transporter 2/3/5
MTVRRFALVAGPAAFAGMLLLDAADGTMDPALGVGALALWMSVWWMTEAVALHVTALLPLVVLPPLGVGTALDVARAYGHELVFLFLGAFLLAEAIERRGLHRRIALVTLERVGTAPRRLVLGFLVAAALVSAFLSNTATAAMLMPVAAAVSLRAVGSPGTGPSGPRLDTALVLAVAYGASIGGILTPIGTPPNGLFFAEAKKAGVGQELNFLSYALAVLPVAVIEVFAAWFFLARRLPRAAEGAMGSAARDALRQERRALGFLRPAEKRVLWTFGVTVVLWATRAPIEIGDLRFPGWAGGLGLRGVEDSTVAVGAALLLMLLPSGEGDGPVLAPSAIQTIRWDLLILFGGGFALGDAFKTSGLNAVVGQGLAGMADLPLPVVLLALALTVTALSEIATNTPLAAAALPVLASGAKEAGLAPTPILLAATLAASLGFMLPVGTAPNAIAFATGRAPVRVMIRTGLGIDLAGSVAIALVVWLWSSHILAP